MRFNIILISLLTFGGIFAQEKTDFTLNEAILYANDHSYAMQNANDDIEIAKKKVWETTTMGLPQINGTVDYQYFIKQPKMVVPSSMFDFSLPVVQLVQGYFGLTPNAYPQAAEGYTELSFGLKQNLSASATMTQLLFNGSYLVGLQSAQVYLKISESIKEKTQISIKQGVVNAYAGVLMSRDAIDILKKNKQNLEKMLSDTHEVIKNGFAEEQNAEQLALTLTTIDNQLKNIERLEQYNLNMLKYIMGIPTEQNLVLTQKLSDVLVQHQTGYITPETFDYTNHIDYKMAENNVNANQLLVKLEQSKALPSLAAFVNYGVKADNDEFKFFNKDQKWINSSIFGVSMNIPIFSSLQRSSRVQQAKIGLDKAERLEQETIEKLNLAFQSAKINYENALQNFYSAKEGLKLAESIEHKESIKFKEGLSGSFELNQAQMQLFAKQQEYLQSIFELISKKAGLDNAMGQ